MTQSWKALKKRLSNRNNHRPLKKRVPKRKPNQLQKLVRRRYLLKRQMCVLRNLQLVGNRQGHLPLTQSLKVTCFSLQLVGLSQHQSSVDKS